MFFYFIRRTPYSISCKAGLLVMNFLKEILFGKVFIPPLFLKDSFAGYSILGDNFFSTNSLNMSYHFLAYKLPDEKCADSVMGIPLYMTLLLLL